MNDVQKTNLNPVRLEGTKEDDVRALRKRFHEIVDAMFDHIEYDDHGDAVNVIRAESSTEYHCPPVVADVVAPLPVGEKLELYVSSTYNQIKKRIEALETKKLVDAQRDSAGFTVEKRDPMGSLG